METSRLITSRDTQLWLLSNQSKKSNNSHNKSYQKHRLSYLKVIPSLTVKKTLMIVILRTGRLVKRAQIVTLVIPMIFTLQD